MTTDMDLDLTFHDIATAGFKVVRTWAFNDVPKKPSSGPYFQVSFDPFHSSFRHCLTHGERFWMAVVQLSTKVQTVFNGSTK
jgi:hypothetical protein